ncbi:6-phosphofructokinase [Pseudoflavonifractor sp. MSJ-37]|uniref:6-phosphofructokinase n=1 Tax=Pseudoflavonifractor sp. MSJ-37 TaxID=2841531 RepID=UPI001C124AE0|nr:6-phosphofructokinase [Pseudoflavonifractor sp. MSJ-37]MBU5434762.1 6-phosphofructokinase [Pseudoflavonifractor sp. MSJ-37]
MNELKGACIIGQSGGPTAVINASALGVIRTALDSGNITRVLGAANGIKGVLEDRLYDMGLEDPAELELLRYTPSSELGSCRYKLADPEKDDADYKRILEIFQKYDVRYFFYNGGNDSMDTCNKISKYMQESGYECRIIGVPKTIDNDLNGTDHCPGFGSAAKFIATTCMEVFKDTHVYDTGAVTVIEIMGRHAGWLAGSAALATWAGYGPDLVYLPEVDFDMDRFLADVKEIYARKGGCMIAVSEGIHYADGSFVSEAKAASATDSFGHVQLGGLASILAQVVKKATGAKVRGIELSLLQRCGAHVASQTDIDEAYAAGRAAVEAAVSGVTDKMVAFRCDRENGYRCETVLEPLDIVANFEKKVPREWINADGNGVEQPFIDYVLPLIQGEPTSPKVDSLPRFAKLKKVLAASL